jgi:hypothetical protein
MLTIRSRNAAVLPSLAASCTSDGVDTRSARAHRADARTSPINPSADLAGRATRLGLEVIANNPRQDFDQPGCQDGLRLTLTMETPFKNWKLPNRFKPDCSRRCFRLFHRWITRGFASRLARSGLPSFFRVSVLHFLGSFNVQPGDLGFEVRFGTNPLVRLLN